MQFISISSLARVTNKIHTYKPVRKACIHVIKHEQLMFWLIHRCGNKFSMRSVSSCFSIFIPYSLWFVVCFALRKSENRACMQLSDRRIYVSIDLWNTSISQMKWWCQQVVNKKNPFVDCLWDAYINIDIWHTYLSWRIFYAFLSLDGCVDLYIKCIYRYICELMTVINFRFCYL